LATDGVGRKAADVLGSKGHVFFVSSSLQGHGRMLLWWEVGVELVEGEMREIMWWFFFLFFFGWVVGTNIIIIYWHTFIISLYSTSFLWVGGWGDYHDHSQA